MKRSVLKVAAASSLPILMFLIPGSPASADPLHFQPAQVNGPGPGCSGKVTAEVSASRGQQARPSANFIASSARVTVNFTPDPNPLGSISASPGGNCEIPVTVTMRNLNTGAHKTETRHPIRRPLRLARRLLHPRQFGPGRRPSELEPQPGRAHHRRPRPLLIHPADQPPSISGRG